MAHFQNSWFSFCKMQFVKVGIIICFSFHLCLPDINFRFDKDTFFLSTTFDGLPRIVKTADGRIKLARPICTWHKQGHLLIAMPLKVEMKIQI